MYFFLRNCRIRTATSRTPMTTDVPDSPNPSVSLRKSAAVSPTVVHKILMTQK